MKEDKKPKVEIVRNEKYENGVKKDDYLDVRYYPDETVSYVWESFSISTNNLKGLIDALQKKQNDITGPDDLPF